MCDEHTGAGNAERTGLTRREFAAIGTAAAFVANTPLSATTRPLTEAMVEITTPDGRVDAFLVHPATGRHPGIILWPDAIGLRDVKKAMARRLASEGYAVLVPNPYYRSARAPLDLSFALFRTPEGRQRIMPLMTSLTPEAIGRDATAHVAFLDAQRGVDTGRGIGVQGYCMGGALSVRTAATVPARVRAVASFHGGGLVSDQPTSPHRLLPSTQARYLIAVAQDDDQRAPTDKDTFRAAALAAGRPAEVEVYRGDHGWCVPDAPAYNQAEADRAWTRLLALYARL